MDMSMTIDGVMEEFGLSKGVMDLTGVAGLVREDGSVCRKERKGWLGLKRWPAKEKDETQLENQILFHNYF